MYFLFNFSSYVQKVIHYFCFYPISLTLVSKQMIHQCIFSKYNKCLNSSSVSMWVLCFIYQNFINFLYFKFEAKISDIHIHEQKVSISYIFRIDRCKLRLNISYY